MNHSVKNLDADVEPARVWQCDRFSLHLDRPKIMGIVNVTPDSFSDGGHFDGVEQAVAHGLDLLDAGADILDIGGESTRPGFTPVEVEEELKRVLPVIQRLAETGACISIDTRHAQVAEAALEAGAHIINDVTGFQDPAMREVAANSKAGCILMFPFGFDGRMDFEEQMRTNHQPVSGKPESLGQEDLEKKTCDILEQLETFFKTQARLLQDAGVDAARICLDPGPGFAKSATEDALVLQAEERLVVLGYPVLCAVSRKRMVKALSAKKHPLERDEATAGFSLAAAQRGARILRVHDVDCCFQVVNAFWQIVHPVTRKAFIAMGSNLGNPVSYLKQARDRIAQLPLTQVAAVSSIYDTEPAYGIASSVADCILEVKTQLHPLILIQSLLDIEDALGRTRDVAKGKGGDRTVDLDLIWMEHEVHAGRRLTLPHSRLGERDFVLIPLVELWPEGIQRLEAEGVAIAPEAERYGHIISRLGSLD